MKDQLRRFEENEAKDYAVVRMGFTHDGPVYQVFFKFADGAFYVCQHHGKNDPTTLAQATARAQDFSYSDVTA